MLCDATPTPSGKSCLCCVGFFREAFRGVDPGAGAGSRTREENATEPESKCQHDEAALLFFYGVCIYKSPDCCQVVNGVRGERTYNKNYYYYYDNTRLWDVIVLLNYNVLFNSCRIYTL